MRGKRVKIGNFKHDNVRRSAPTEEKFKRWKEAFLESPALADYDAYLWGSWPERENTSDIDILLTKGAGSEMTTEEMEELSLSSLEESLVNNNFLADVGFTDEGIKSFKRSMDYYNVTGKSLLSTGYVYGNIWEVDGKVVKDRAKWKGPKVELLDNNIAKMSGEQPYHKQLANLDKFDSWYSSKPVKIKDRRKIY